MTIVPQHTQVWTDVCRGNAWNRRQTRAVSPRSSSHMSSYIAGVERLPSSWYPNSSDILSFSEYLISSSQLAPLISHDNHLGCSPWLKRAAESQGPSWFRSFQRNYLFSHGRRLGFEDSNGSIYVVRSDEWQQKFWIPLSRHFYHLFFGHFHLARHGVSSGLRKLREVGRWFMEPDLSEIPPRQRFSSKSISWTQHHPVLMTHRMRRHGWRPMKHGMLFKWIYV
jgi:hypothetical protein